MKFMINEMKPTYHNNGGGAGIISSQKHEGNHIATAAASLLQDGSIALPIEKESADIQKSLNQIRSHSLIELEGGALGLLSNGQINHYSGLLGSKVFLHNEIEEDETSYPDNNITNAYSFKQLIGLDQQIAQPFSNNRNAKKQGLYTNKTPQLQKSPKARSGTRADNNGPGSSPHKHMEQSAATHSPNKLNIKIPPNNDQERIVSYFEDNAEDSNTKVGGAVAVVSERHSVDSSQYKTIKFKLMIMKSPRKAKLQ